MRGDFMNNKTVERFDIIVSEMRHNLIQKISNDSSLSNKESALLCFAIDLIAEEIISNSDKLLREVTEM